LRKDFRIIFLAEKIGFKRNYLKRQGQGSNVIGWSNGKMCHGVGPVQEGKTRRGEKGGWLREIGSKELRELRKESQIFRS
jgi:hypothetical protein